MMETATVSKTIENVGKLLASQKKQRELLLELVLAVLYKHLGRATLEEWELLSEAVKRSSSTLPHKRYDYLRKSDLKITRYVTAKSGTVLVKPYTEEPYKISKEELERDFINLRKLFE